MRAIILAGGRGSRLDPLTRHLPKPLVPFFGRPLIERQIRWLTVYGFSDIVISLGHLGNLIEDALGPEQYGARLHYVYETQPQGTAGAVAWAFSQYPTDEGTLVIPGDCLADYDLDRVYQYFLKRHESFGMIVHRVEDARQFGVVEANPHGRVIRLIEKPSVIEGGQLVNTGIYVLKPHAMGWPSARPLDFAYDVFPELIAAEQMASLEVDGYWSDLGTLGQYRESHFDVMRGRVHLPYTIEDTDNVIVDGQARIIGPVWLGDDVTIDAQATIGPNVVLGAGTYVGPWTHVENTIVGQHAFLGAGTRTQDAIIGDRVALGGRCRVGRHAAIGSDTRVGWGTEVTPGTRISPETRISPMPKNKTLPSVATS